MLKQLRRSSFARLLRAMRPYATAMLAGLLLVAIAGGLMAAVVATLKPLFGASLSSAAEGVKEVPTGADILRRLQQWIPPELWPEWLQRHSELWVPLLFVALFLVRGVTLYFGQYLTMKVGAQVIRDLRAQLYGRLVFQSAGFFRVHNTGLLLSRILSDVQRLQRVSATVLADLVRVGAGAPALLLVALLHDWRMTVFALVVLPGIAYPMLRFGRRLRKASRQSQESLATAASQLQETISGIRIVQSFGMERFEIGRFGRALQDMLRADLKGGRAGALSTPVLEQVASIGGALLFAYAGIQIRRNALDPADFGVVAVSLALLFMSLRRLGQINADIQQAMAAADRVFELMDWPQEVVNLPGATPLPATVETVRYEGVSFAYDDEPVLSAVDIELPRGQVVALVGPSGGGKSTIANLLPRFYDTSGGQVTIDGRDIRSATLESLRSLIGVVTQETVLFDDSVLHNITCGRDDVPFALVQAAAEAAHAQEFIERLPEGYHTRLGERGARLSHGQRQRIAIARALLKDAPILILDEATSALDSESERLVQAALDRLLEGRCSLVIAHRLSTIRRADRILALDAGRIVEQGTHEELLAKGGLYARLHALQQDGLLSAADSTGGSDSMAAAAWPASVPTGSQQ